MAQVTAAGRKIYSLFTFPHSLRSHYPQPTVVSSAASPAKLYRHSRGKAATRVACPKMFYAFCHSPAVGTKTCPPLV